MQFTCDIIKFIMVLNECDTPKSFSLDNPKLKAISLDTV